MTDTGGGNALNVQRFVEDLIDAGAAGCFLEVRSFLCIRVIDIFSLCSFVRAHIKSFSYVLSLKAYD